MKAPSNQLVGSLLLHGINKNVLLLVKDVRPWHHDVRVYVDVVSDPSGLFVDNRGLPLKFVTFFDRERDHPWGFERALNPGHYGRFSSYDVQ